MSDEPAECPLCMEALDIDDHSFFPCTCGYQICRFCWHRIRTDENGLCPACRKQYPEDPAEFKPLTDDELQSIKKERKQKDVQKKQKAAENRKHLSNVRVVQRNLVFVVGLSPRLADPEVLKKHEYFGKFGKIHKVVINQSTSYAGSQGPSASAYVTYVKPEDALRAILTVNNVHVDGRTLKTSLGTTKYCSHFLKGSHCQKNDCMYLHELGEEAASFTKEEMQAGKHQEYEQMLIEQFLNAQNCANNHHVGNIKFKKSNSPQTLDNSEIIPSLMDMTGDIKRTQHNGGPLLANPVNGGPSVHLNNSNSSRLAIDGVTSHSSSSGSKTEHTTVGSNNRTQGHSNKSQLRSETPPASSHIGNGSQKSSISANITDENHLPNVINNPGSTKAPATTPPGDREKVSTSSHNEHSSHLSLPLSTPVSISQHLPVSPRAGSSIPVSTAHSHAVISADNAPHAQCQQLQPQADQNSVNGIGAIGSNRRLSEASNAKDLSFFENSLLNNINTARAQSSANSFFRELPNVSLPNLEISDSLPVSTSTDWSAAFGFRNKELQPEDDLGFDPCAESFKGLADLIEKENGLQQQQHYLNTSQQQHKKLGFSQQSNFLPHSLPLSPLQNNTQLVRSVPPGFSLTQLQQQQHRQYLRQDMNSSKLIDLQSQLTPTGHQRFSSYHNLQPDMHVHPQQQPELYHMKDMQEQLRSMLPNINISFGSLPHQQLAQQHQISTSLHQTQQSLQSNKSWPLSSSVESSVWNDPAIVSTSQFTDSAGIFQDTSSWLKSLQQLTETEGPCHRLPFVQQFPLAGFRGWPPHTYNPPPGFRSGGFASQQSTETHKMAEVLQ